MFWIILLDLWAIRMFEFVTSLISCFGFVPCKPVSVTEGFVAVVKCCRILYEMCGMEKKN